MLHILTIENEGYCKFNINQTMSVFLNPQAGKVWKHLGDIMKDFPKVKIWNFWSGVWNSICTMTATALINDLTILSCL